MYCRATAVSHLKCVDRFLNAALSPLTPSPAIGTRRTQVNRGWIVQMALKNRLFTGHRGYQQQNPKKDDVAASFRHLPQLVHLSRDPRFRSSCTTLSAAHSGMGQRRVKGNRIRSHIHPRRLAPGMPALKDVDNPEVVLLLSCGIEVCHLFFRQSFAFSILDAEERFGLRLATRPGRQFRTGVGR